MKKWKIAKIGEEFDKELKEIQRKRWLEVDKDLKKPISIERLTNFMIKNPEWKLLKDRSIREPRKEKLKRW